MVPQFPRRGDESCLISNLLSLLNLSALLMVLRASSFLPTDICHLGDSGRKKKRRTTDSIGNIDAIWNCLQSAMQNRNPLSLSRS